MKHLFIIFTILLAAITVQAQNRVSTTRQTAKAIVLPSPLAARQITSLRISGMEGMASALELRCAQAMMAQQNSPLSTIPATPKTKDRPWLVQQQRNFKAWKLHRQRRLRDQQNQKEQEALQAQKELEAKLPQPNPQMAFETTDFANLLSEQIPQEELPLVAKPGFLYRGMALSTDGDALKNILQNGLLLADVGLEANTRNLAFSGGNRAAMTAIVNAPVINLTSFPVNAAEWAAKRLTNNKQLLVVVSVKEQTQSGKIVTVAQDIPAQQITHVFAPLLVEGTPAWCNIELTDQNTFLITPYNISPEQ